MHFRAVGNTAIEVQITINLGKNVIELYGQNFNKLTGPK